MRLSSGDKIAAATVIRKRKEEQEIVTAQDTEKKTENTAKSSVSDSRKAVTKVIINKPKVVTKPKKR